MSPEMKHGKDFLFSISGGTCSKQIAVSSNLFCFIVNHNVLSFAIQEVFSAFKQLCSLFIVYLLTKTIRSSFSIFGIRSYLGGFVEL
jgi:hypothetical protein